MSLMRVIGQDISFNIGIEQNIRLKVRNRIKVNNKIRYKIYTKGQVNKS